MSLLLVPDGSLQLDNDGEEAELELQGYGILADVVKEHEQARTPAFLKPDVVVETATLTADADLAHAAEAEDKLPVTQPGLQHHDPSLSLIDEDTEERDDVEMEAVVPGSPVPELELDARPISTEISEVGSGTFGLGFDGTTMAPALLPLSPTRTAKRDEAEAEAEAEAAAAAADVMEQVLDQIDRRDEDMTMLKASPAAGVANLDRMGVCERNELELSIEQQADFSRDQANAIVYGPEQLPPDDRPFFSSAHEQSTPPRRSRSPSPTAAPQKAAPAPKKYNPWARENKVKTVSSRFFSAERLADSPASVAGKTPARRGFVGNSGLSRKFGKLKPLHPQQQEQQLAVATAKPPPRQQPPSPLQSYIEASSEDDLRAQFAYGT